MIELKSTRERGGVMKAIVNGKILLEDGVLEDSVILFWGKIIDIISHIHGSNNSDVMDATEEAMRNISETINPAKLIGVDNKKRTIEIGKNSDFVIMYKKFEVLKTVVAGKIVYEK